MSDNRLADEAAYFGAVEDARSSWEDERAELRAEIEALRYQNRELVTELKIRDDVIGDLQNRLISADQ